MKTFSLFHPASGPVLAAMLALACPGAVLAQVADDFNDGNDAGWTRYDPLAAFGLSAIFSFPGGGYRLQTTYLTGQAQNPGRAGSVLAGTYTNFYVSVDVVNWNDNLPQSFGVLARIGGLGLQQTTGYAFTWDRGTPSDPTGGDVDISSITGEAPTGLTLLTLTNAYGGGDSIRLTNGNTYRFVFIGVGSRLEGRIYQHPDLVNPKIAVQATDSTYASGRNGLVVFDNSGGQNQTDATYDNWYMSDIEPPRLRISEANVQTGDLVLTWPGYASNFVFEAANVLPGGTNWAPVTGAIFAPGTFPLDPSNPNFLYFGSTVGGDPRRVFRLRRP
jgi:hypothetical protein